LANCFLPNTKNPLTDILMVHTSIKGLMISKPKDRKQKILL